MWGQQKKNTELATKKKQEFDRTTKSVNKQEDKNIRNRLTSHNPKEDIKLAFQHAGGVLSDCSNTRYSTYIDAIMAKYVSVYEAALSTTSTTTSTNSTSTNDTSTSTSMREEEEDLVSVEVWSWPWNVLDDCCEVVMQEWQMLTAFRKMF